MLAWVSVNACDYTQFWLILSSVLGNKQSATFHSMIVWFRFPIHSCTVQQANVWYSRHPRSSVSSWKEFERVAHFKAFIEVIVKLQFIQISLDCIVYIDIWTWPLHLCPLHLLWNINLLNWRLVTFPIFTLFSCHCLLCCILGRFRRRGTGLLCQIQSTSKTRRVSWHSGWKFLQCSPVFFWTFSTHFSFFSSVLFAIYRKNTWKMKCVIWNVKQFVQKKN